MKRHNNKLLLASLVAGIFLLTGCGATVEEGSEGDGTATSGITNLFVDISSPALNQLYGDDRPELRYTITEGEDSTDVPLNRLGVSVFNTDDEGERIIGSALIAEDVSSGARLPAVEDGGHELQLIIRDDAGDPQVTLIIAYATDITPPEVNVVSFVTNETTPILRYTIDDPCFDSGTCDESVTILDSDGNTVVSDAKNGDELPLLEEGEYTLIVSYTDAAGNNTTVQVTFTLDRTSNDILVADFITNEITPVLSYTIDEPCFTTELGCDETVEIFDSNGVVIVSKEDNLRNGDTMPALAEGQYTLDISYTDQAGNITTVQTTFVIDTTSNEIQITDIVTNDPTPILIYSIDEPCFADNSCGEIVTLDGEKIDTRNGQPLPALDDSTPDNPSYTVEITYSDEAGNTSTETLTFIIDATPPEVVVIDPDAPATDPNDPDPAPDLRDTDITDGGDTLLITGSLGEGTVTFTSSENGTASVTLTDEAGVISILDPPAGATLVADQPGWFEVIQGGEYTVTLSSLVVGNYTVEVFVMDDLGNQADAPLTFTFNVQFDDAPTARIDSPSEGALLYPPEPTSELFNVTYTFTVSDDVNQPQEITVSVTLEEWSDANGGSWVAAGTQLGGLDESMLTISGQEGTYQKIVAMPDGKYRLEFTATDTSGTPTTRWREFSVDTTAPVVQIDNPVDGSVQSTSSPTLEFKADELSDFGVEVKLCVLLTGSWDCWISSTTAGSELKDADGNPLPNGEYTVSVTLTDAAGFTGSDEIGFTVNAGPSEITILEPVQNEVITSGKTQVRIRESGFSHATLSVYFGGSSTPEYEKTEPVGFPEPNVEVFNNVPLPSNGTYTLTVVATDDTGVNPDASASVTVTTDLSLPVVEISSPSTDDSNRHFMKSEPVPFTYNVYANSPYTVTEYKAWIAETGQQIGLPSLSDTVMMGPFTAIPGNHAIRTVVLWAKNDNGGISEISRQFFIDSAIPVVSDLMPTNGSETTENPLLSYVIKDSDTGSLETTRNESVWLDGGPISQRSGDSLGGLNLVPGQTYTITVQVEDLAGNVSDKNALSASTTFTILTEEDEDDHHHKHHKHEKHGEHGKHGKHDKHHKHEKRWHKSSCKFGADKDAGYVVGDLVKCVKHHAKKDD